MIGFTLRGGIAHARTLIDALELFSRMSHMVDARSLVLHSGTTSHAHLTPEERLALGIGPGLVRLSVGLEDEPDLIADLAQAFGAVRAEHGVARLVALPDRELEPVTHPEAEATVHLVTAAI